jgi:hypothetical protein
MEDVHCTLKRLTNRQLLATFAQQRPNRIVNRPSRAPGLAASLHAMAAGSCLAAASVADEALRALTVG